MTMTFSECLRRLAIRGGLACGVWAMAATARAACFGYYCSAPIQDMTITEDAVYIRLVGGTAGLTNCTPYSGSYFTLLKSNSNYGSYYATLLAAYLAKESVSLRPVDGSTNCILSYIAVP